MKLWIDKTFWSHLIHKHIWWLWFGLIPNSSPKTIWIHDLNVWFVSWMLIMMMMTWTSDDPMRNGLLPVLKLEHKIKMNIRWSDCWVESSAHVHSHWNVAFLCVLHGTGARLNSRTKQSRNMFPFPWVQSFSRG